MIVACSLVSATQGTISDPVRIRALSHPLRLDLIDALAEGPLTATECAELTGESVASCSFHLRMLAKYGFVVADERRGRERPWRLVWSDQRLEPDDQESLVAIRDMAHVYLERATQRVRHWLARLPDAPDEWVMASTVLGGTFWVTADEMRAMSRALQQVGEEFRARHLDPSSRPPGARPVRVFSAVHVDVEEEERAARRRR
jgi:DNA-binding transcriptional ArsR family regulator